MHNPCVCAPEGHQHHDVLGNAKSDIFADVAFRQDATPDHMVITESFNFAMSQVDENGEASPLASRGEFESMIVIVMSSVKVKPGEDGMSPVRNDIELSSVNYAATGAYSMGNNPAISGFDCTSIASCDLLGSNLHLHPEKGMIPIIEKIHAGLEPYEGSETPEHYNGPEITMPMGAGVGITMKAEVAGGAQTGTEQEEAALGMSGMMIAMIMIMCPQISDVFEHAGLNGDAHTGHLINSIPGDVRVAVATI